LDEAGINDGLITDDNRQKILQAIGPLRRKGAKRVVYELSPKALIRLSTTLRPSDSCSAAELRRGSKTVFYTEDCMKSLPDEQRDFFEAVSDPDGEFVSGRVEVNNPADFKTPMNLIIADATPERKFIRELTERKNAVELNSWIKSTSNNFYSLEYAWKKGEHTKRGEFNPDFFLVRGDQVYVVEIKDDGELSDPSVENVKKHEYAVAHFSRLNAWLENADDRQRYQFNMLSPRDYAAFFQKLRGNTLTGYRSELDVVMINAASKAR
jgi:type III restriction enzyme